MPLGGADVPAFAARDGDRPAHRAGARFGAHREEAVPVAQHRADAPHAPLPEARHPQPPGAPRHHRGRRGRRRVVGALGELGADVAARKFPDLNQF